MKPGSVITLTNKQRFFVALMLEYEGKMYGYCVSLDSELPQAIICEEKISKFKGQKFISVVDDENLAKNILNAQKKYKNKNDR